MAFVNCTDLSHLDRWFFFSFSIRRMEYVTLRRALGARKAVLVRQVSSLFPVTNDTATRSLCIAGHRYDLSQGA
jgi:hypothetical protein